MKNRLSDLNDHLFTQMERLANEDMKPKELELELSRAKAMSGIARDIIGNGRLVLDATVAKHEHGIKSRLPMLEDKSSE